MRKFMKLAFASVLALAATALPGASSHAVTEMKLSVISTAVDEQPVLQKVSKKRRHWRWKRRHGGGKWRHKHYSKKWGGHRKRYWRKRHRRFYRRPGIYLGLGYLGGYRRHYRDDYDYDTDYYRSSCGTIAEKERCARKFRSFNWDTCRYTTYSGHKRLCPYVR